MQFGVSESLSHWGKYRPNAVAVRHNGKITTYGKLNTIINDISYHINQADFLGERVGICVKSKFDFLISLVGILRVGKSAVLLNAGLPDEALSANIKDAEIESFIHDNVFSERIATLTKEFPKSNCFNIGKLTKGLLYKTDAEYKICNPEDEWGVLYSSGTTGIPKGIERDHNSIVTELLGWCLEMGLNRETVFYIGRPIYYTGGLVLSLSTLITCGQLVLNDFTNDNDPAEVWDDYQKTLESLALTWAFFVPDQIRTFMQIIENSDITPAFSKMILTMGAAISGEEKVKANHLLGSGIVESWGNSESLGTITEPEDLEKRPNSIGRPFLTDELYVVDENCKSLAPRQYGKIAGSEEAGFSNYCNRPDATRRTKQKNLIISEDIGYIDEEGYFYICGRQQDCIVRNGKTLFKSDIESKLRRIKSVAECAIATRDIDDTASELIAVVVPSDSHLTNKDLFLSELNAVLTPNEQLNDVLLIKSIPHTSSGKIDRTAVDKLVRGQ